MQLHKIQHSNATKLNTILSNTTSHNATQHSPVVSWHYLVTVTQNATTHNKMQVNYSIMSQQASLKML